MFEQICISLSGPGLAMRVMVEFWGSGERGILEEPCSLGEDSVALFSHGAVFVDGAECEHFQHDGEFYFFCRLITLQATPRSGSWQCW